MTDNLSLLREDCLQCSRCGLCQGRTKLVFGTGAPGARVMFIGEGPGEQEDLQGEPFVGPAGKLLDTMLEIFDLDRKRNVYICNVVKCRPPRNRDPQTEEIAACSHWLEQQIQLVDPDIIVCLGRIAAKAIIDPDFRITREHGVWFDIDRRRVMATYHPSALLRDESKRPDAFQDFRLLRREIQSLCPGVFENHT